MNYRKCLTKATRNREFVNDGMTQFIKKYPDWISVIAFYSALHFVDAYLMSRHGIYCKHHDERSRAVEFHMQEIFVEYQSLYDLGFRARYFSVEDSPSSKEAQDAVTFDLVRIEEFVRNSVS